MVGEVKRTVGGSFDCTSCVFLSPDFSEATEFDSEAESGRGIDAYEGDVVLDFVEEAPQPRSEELDLWRNPRVEEVDRGREMR